MSDLPQRDEEVINKEIFGTRPAPRARFFMHGARDEGASVAAGYPVFENKLYVEIRIPDSTDFVSHPATPGEIRQFAESYARFERYKDWNQHNLELLPQASPALLATARALGLFTIEQLAAHVPETAPWTKLDDGDPFPRLHGELPPALHELRTAAQRYVSFCKPRMRLIDGKLESAA